MPDHGRGDAARVRELCRRLKPIIGEQADRIWMAYVAEDEVGKAQVQDYLELLAIKHFRATLESEDPGLLPPKTEGAAGEYQLGTVHYNGRDLYAFGLREGEWTQHVGVFGRSGAGKTNLGFLIAQQLLAHEKPVLILDWKRNYRDLVALPGFEEVAVYTVGRATCPFFFNPLIPPPHTPPQTWLKKLISVIAHAYLLGDGVIYLLQEALDDVYRRSGVHAGSVDRWPTFADVLRTLKSRQATGREAGWMSSALRAIASLCFGEMGTLVNQGHDDVASLLMKPVILELDALTQSDKVFFTEAILLWIHHFRMSEPTRESFKHAVIIEEAHHVLSGERQSLVGGQSVMDLTFREIREFGEAMIILDQHPSQISIPALGNTYCTICFNLKHRTDVSAMAQAMLLQDDEKNLLGDVQVGQAVVRLQGRSVKPFMISVPEFHIKKGAFTDAMVVRHMTRLGLLSARKQAREAFVQGPGSELVPGARSEAAGGEAADLRSEAPASASGDQPSSLRPELRAFLADLADFPDGGVTERYKRLGVSVRRGQALKEQLLEHGLVSEELQTTRLGRVRVIRLTEQGELVLRDADEASARAT